MVSMYESIDGLYEGVKEGVEDEVGKTAGYIMRMVVEEEGVVRWGVGVGVSEYWRVCGVFSWDTERERERPKKKSDAPLWWRGHS